MLKTLRASKNYNVHYPHTVSSAHSRAEQQAIFLEKRQMQFKRAAVDAKNSG